MDFVDILKCDEQNKDVFEELKGYCAKEKIIPFVGAGISIPPYPSWRDTLIELISTYERDNIGELEVFLQQGKYEEAADFVLDKLGKGQFERKFKKIFSEEKIKNIGLSNSIRLLPHLFSRTVITTNYDKCLEYAYFENNNPFSSIVTPKDVSTLENILTQITRDNPHYLWKMHGDIDDFSKRVFTSQEYTQVYENNVACKNAIRTFFQHNRFLFIGCSLSGSDRYLKIIKELGCNADITNYALLRRPRDDEEFIGLKKILSNHWIFPIWYPYEDTVHESVYIILRKLIDDIREEVETISNISSTFKENNVSDYIEKELKKRDVKVIIPQIEGVTLDDLVAICLGHSICYSKTGLEMELFNLLGEIYDRKYLNFLLDKDVRGFNKDWYETFDLILKRQKVGDVSAKRTLVVGVGNGEEGKYFNYGEISAAGNLILADIAKQSLKSAQNKYPRAICINQPAQDLSRIAANSIELYISTRVYQSSYFNIDRALYEATRILKKKGVILISIANGFVNVEDGTYIRGLLNADGVNIDKQKPQLIVKYVYEKLLMLGYKKMLTEECKSEIFVSAIKC